jgi:hypothetical protein
MSDDQEEDIIDKLAKLLPMVKILIGGASCIAMALLSVAAWVWTEQSLNASQEERIQKIVPRVESLENWKLIRDSSPAVTLSDLHAMDKRLSSHEDKLATIKEQNALILETLRKLESRP